MSGSPSAGDVLLDALARPDAAGREQRRCAQPTLRLVACAPDAEGPEHAALAHAVSEGSSGHDAEPLPEDGRGGERIGRSRLEHRAGVVPERVLRGGLRLPRPGCATTGGRSGARRSLPPVAHPFLERFVQRRKELEEVVREAWVRAEASGIDEADRTGRPRPAGRARSSCPAASATALRSRAPRARRQRRGAGLSRRSLRASLPTRTTRSASGRVARVGSASRAADLVDGSAGPELVWHERQLPESFGIGRTDRNETGGRTAGEEGQSGAGGEPSASTTTLRRGSVCPDAADRSQASRPLGRGRVPRGRRRTTAPGSNAPAGRVRERVTPLRQSAASISPAIPDAARVSPITFAAGPTAQLGSAPASEEAYAAASPSSARSRETPPLAPSSR